MILSQFNILIKLISQKLIKANCENSSKIASENIVKDITGFIDNDYLSRLVSYKYSKYILNNDNNQNLKIFIYYFVLYYNLNYYY